MKERNGGDQCHRFYESKYSLREQHGLAVTDTDSGCHYFYVLKNLQSQCIP